MTVLEVIQRSTEFLQARGVDSPRLQVELMLAQLLGMPRLKLYLNFEKVLQEQELATLREWVKRRGLREPLQHILGSTSFCGLEIEVSPAALVPRPETEMLAEMGWKFLNTRPGPSMFLDYGTGTGCIALAVLQNNPRSRAIALDISTAALRLAARNAARLGLEQRLELGHSSELPGGPPCFDLILSNPPYIPTEELKELQPEVQKFDPALALDGGADGLSFYRKLAAKAGECLQPHGKIMVEFGDGQDQAVQLLFKEQNWIVDGIISDYSGRPRFLTAGRGGSE